MDPWEFITRLSCNTGLEIFHIKKKKGIIRDREKGIER